MQVTNLLPQSRVPFVGMLLLLQVNCRKRVPVPSSVPEFRRGFRIVDGQVEHQTTVVVKRQRVLQPRLVRVDVIVAKLSHNLTHTRFKVWCIGCVLLLCVRCGHDYFLVVIHHPAVYWFGVPCIHVAHSVFISKVIKANIFFRVLAWDAKKVFFLRQPFEPLNQRIVRQGL